MKLLLALAIFVGSLTTLSAQYDDPAVPARAATAELVERYALSTDQQVEVQRIQVRYFTNLTRLEKLEAQDLTYYVQKRRALDEGTRSSLEQLLDKEQLVIFNRERRELRRRKAATVKALAASGKTELEIQLALLDVE